MVCREYANFIRPFRTVQLWVNSKDNLSFAILYQQSLWSIFASLRETRQTQKAPFFWCQKWQKACQKWLKVKVISFKDLCGFCTCTYVESSSTFCTLDKFISHHKKVLSGSQACWILSQCVAVWRKMSLCM